MATPVWFAEESGTLYAYSLANAGKVKRIRNNPRVRIVPCDVRGKPKGEWVEANARILDEQGAALGHKLLNKKYGWMKRIGDAFSKLRQRQSAVIAKKKRFELDPTSGEELDALIKEVMTQPPEIIDRLKKLLG